MNRFYVFYLLFITVVLIVLSIGVYNLFEDLDEKYAYNKAGLNELNLTDPTTSKLKLTKVDDGYTLEVIDGEGSELDSDLFDGKDSSFYLDLNNLDNGVLSPEFYSAIEDLEEEGYIIDGKLSPTLLDTEETSSDLNSFSGSSNITKLGKIVTGVWNAEPITTEYIADKTIALADLARNGCSEGETIKWNNVLNSWDCAIDLQSTPGSVDWAGITNKPAGLDDGDDDTVLTESQVETFVTNSAINLATGSQVNSQTIATQNWIGSQGYLTSYTETDPTLASWTGSTNISSLGTVVSGVWNGTPITTAYIADGTIALGDLGQNGCSDGQVLKWSTSNNSWVCSSDLNTGTSSLEWNSILNRPAGLDDGDDDTVLSESQVESFVTNAAINLATGSQVNSQNIATENWVSSQGYLASYAESDPSLATWTGSANISTLGTVLTGVWNGSPITTAYIADGTIALGDLGQNGCTDGQVLKWSDPSYGWICATDNAGSGTVSLSAVYEKWDPDAPPANPSAYDDEFNDETLDVGWSTLDSGAISENDRYLKLGPGNKYIYKTIPAGDFSIWSKVSISGYPQFQSHSQAIIGVQAGTGTIYDLAITTVATNNTRIDVNVYSSYGVWSSNPIMYNTLMINDLYFSIRRSGTTLSFWVSTDGITYNQFYTATDSGVNRMGLMQLGNSFAYFDYIRYDGAYHDHTWAPPGRIIGMGGGTSTVVDPITTQGDLIVGDIDGSAKRLARGSAGQVLKMDITGTNPVWENQFNNYILLKDEKPSGTPGGICTSNTWVKRTLNTETMDLGNYAALSNSQFTLEPGTYIIKAEAPAYGVYRHKTRLFNVTSGVTQVTGTSAYAYLDGGFPNYSSSSVVGTFTINTAATFELQHRCATQRGDNDFGVETNFGENEVYSVLELWKIN